MRFKIIEYNILNGLCTENRPFNIDGERKKAIVRLLENEKPDILVMTEAACWPTVRQCDMKDYDALFSEMCKADSDPKTCDSFRWAPAVFTRFPINSNNLSKFYKSFLRASVKIGEKSLRLDIVHPNPELSEDDRAEFFRTVIKGRRNPYVIAGDFNSLHPKDQYDAEKMIRGYQGFMGASGKPKALDIMKAEAMRPFVEENLIDTHGEHNSFDFTVPTDWRNKNKDSAVRLDYIFCSSDMTVLESGIIKNESSEKGSDHYPVFAVLEI